MDSSLLYRFVAVVVHDGNNHGNDGSLDRSVPATNIYGKKAVTNFRLIKQMENHVLWQAEPVTGTVQLVMMVGW